MKVRTVFTDAQCHEDSQRVRQNMAVTPAQMEDLTSKGIPVSSANMASVFDDGIPNPDWSVPIDNTRGVDIADVWCAQQDARKNLKNAKVSNVNKVNSSI